jgi:hypothetical protein
VCETVASQLEASCLERRAKDTLHLLFCRSSSFGIATADCKDNGSRVRKAAEPKTDFILNSGNIYVAVVVVEKRWFSCPTEVYRGDISMLYISHLWLGTSAVRSAILQIQAVELFLNLMSREGCCS